MYRYISRESCSQFDSLPLTYFRQADPVASRITSGARDVVEQADALLEAQVLESDDVSDLASQWGTAASDALAASRDAKHKIEDLVLAKKDSDAAREKAALRVAVAERKLNHLHEVIRIENESAGEGAHGSAAPSVTSEMSVVHSLSRAKQVVLHAQSVLDDESSRVEPAQFSVLADDAEDAVDAAGPLFISFVLQHLILLFALCAHLFFCLRSVCLRPCAREARGAGEARQDGSRTRVARAGSRGGGPLRGRR